MNDTLRARQQWDYLASEAFQTRYLAAANYLRHCTHILEVGGCTTPITNYLRGVHDSVTVVDPLVEPLQAEMLNNRPCVVRHIPVTLEDYTPTGGENGFAALGMPQLPLEPVLGIMRRCDVSVLEFPVAFLPSCLMFKAVLGSGYFDVAARIVFDLSHNDVGPLPDANMTARHLFVLEKRRAGAADVRLAKWLRISDEYVRAAERCAWRRNIRDKSAKLLRDHFQSAYTCLKEVRDNGFPYLPGRRAVERASASTKAHGQNAVNTPVKRTVR
jgi:hypothetical protein